MRKKRKSSKAGSSRPGFEIRRVSAIPKDRFAAWDFSWTLQRLRQSQPNPFVKLIPSSLRDTRQSTVSQRFVGTAFHKTRAPFVYVDKGGILVDARTGEMLSAKKVAERLQQDDCRKAREARRHSIISSGHGGRNGVREYSKHKEC